jgi:ribonuclease HII
MPYLIGTDEAGYAPHLGPLVISATVFWVDDLSAGDELYRRLKRVVCRTPPKRAAGGRLAIADSKALYSPAQGLACLERGVLAALSLLERCPGDWLDAWQALDPAAIGHFPTMPWHVDYQLRLPLAADADELVRFVPKLRRGFEAAGVRLIAIASRAVFPDEFNRSNDQWGNKSETLSKTTLALVADALAHCAGEPVLIVCDKHGGRNQYGRLLQQQFPDPLIEVCRESMMESIYRWGGVDARIEARFRAGGEAFLPAALASMTSKYLRELSMRAFNDFWCGRVANLAPTAGYPTDARRFRRAVLDTQRELGIADQIMWRSR